MPEKAVEFQVGERVVRLSSPDKVYFAELGLTKRQVAEYFLSVGPGILAALRDRPTTMERWPGGVREDVVVATRADRRGEAFYQKRAPASVPDWVQTGTVTFPSGRTAEQVCPADLATILWMVNLGTLRFHPWPVRLPDLDAVDELRIDLDPQPGTGFGEAAQAAVVLREILAEAGLTGFPKTSGGRGLHVFCRIGPATFVDARHAVIALGRELARRVPDLVTMSWWKEERGERVFVDFNQLARDRLMTSAYSIRPTIRGHVSAPLEWDEVAGTDPADHTILTMPQRFADRGDVWAPFYAQPLGSLDVALAWYERDAAAGEGEMPYPPEYPKMPGEPPRVQPSRKKRVG
ncbi:DNA polymerase domain-containing protein [Propionicicella superfundia]|uniref:DNA polymerase domain-containing protein n=1 Tax=Propionicicella superfundia TaxID=348582 RepID=UPI0003F74787|nr:ATP-dependent DNA ligase [Propionicicella superfundia]